MLLASFINARSNKKGVIMAWNPPKLYEYQIKGINALSKEIDFTGWEECLDFEFFREMNLAICLIKTDSHESEVYTLDIESYTTMSTGIKCEISEEVVKILARKNESLFIKTGKNELSIYFKISPTLKGRIIRIKHIEGNNLAFFDPVGKNRLVTISQDGALVYYEYNAKEAKYGIVSAETFLPLYSKERCNVVKGCRKGKYFVVTTILETTSHIEVLNRLILFLFNEKTKHFEQLAEIDFNNTEYSRNDYSYFSDINMDFYHGKYPIILAAQCGNPNLLFSYIFDGTELNEFSEHL